MVTRGHRYLLYAEKNDIEFFNPSLLPFLYYRPRPKLCVGSNGIKSAVFPFVISERL